MSGTVLVVGCASQTAHGRDQLSRLAAQARRRGLRLLGLDTAQNLAHAGRSPLDEVQALDVHDPGAAAAWAATASEQVDAVTTFRELCVEPAAAIAAARGLPGNPPEAVHTARTKDLCRRRLVEAGLTQPTCVLVPDRQRAAQVLRCAPGPWIVKPRDGMGSAGVSLVRDEPELAAALDRLGAAGSAGGPGFLVEEFVAGREFSAEGVLVGGAFVPLALTAKALGPDFVESGHRMPAALGAAEEQAAIRTVAAAVAAVGLRHGVVHAEFWLTPAGEVVMGELHARPGGDFIHAMLEAVRPGLELYGTVLDDLLGTRPAPVPPLLRAAGAEFLFVPPGVVEDVSGLAEVRAEPDVIAVGVALTPGDTVSAVGDSAGRHGHLVVGGPDPSAVQHRLAELRARLQIRIRA